MHPGMRRSPIRDSPLLQQPQQQHSLSENIATVQTQQSQPGTQEEQQQRNVAKERTTIWQGSLEWHEKQKGRPFSEMIRRQVLCHVTANVVNGEAEVKLDVWPEKFCMQLIPKGIVRSVGGGYFVDIKTVLFILQPCEALQDLTRVMDDGFAGCIKYTGTKMPSDCPMKVIILLYSKERNAYFGFIPNDTLGFVLRVREVVRQQKSWKEASMRQGEGPYCSMGALPGGLVGPEGGGTMQQNPGSGGMVAGNIPSGIQAQMQQGTMPPGMQQACSIPGDLQAATLLQQQQTLQQQQQQQQGSVDGDNLAEIELEWRKNLMKIQELRQALQAAQARELQFQKLLGPQPGMNAGGQMNQPSTAAGVQRMLRPPGPQEKNNPGLKNLLQESDGAPPFNRTMGSGQGDPRVPGQQQQQQQQPQFDDISILDLLK